jgi:hypothetical protein
MKLVKTASGEKSIKISKKEWQSIGKPAGWMETAQPAPNEEIKIGDSVKLKGTVLPDHSKSVPAHAGYTPEQMSWRETLKELSGQTGVINAEFPNSNHVNVRFESTTIGIGKDQLEKVINVDVDDDSNVSRRRGIKVTFSDGDSVTTEINGTKDEINKYYLGDTTPQDYDIANPEKTRVPVKVEFLG